MDYLLKPSPLIVAGLTLGVADAKATANAKLRIEQFFAIPLAGRVVVPCPVMAIPLYILIVALNHAHARANAKNQSETISLLAP
jgi:ABC-type spermidine/putrescine transport system permease subunit II